EEGFLQVKYNLGSREHHFGHFAHKVNDNKKHTIRIHRNESNVTLQIDGRPPIRYRPKGRRRKSIKLIDPFDGEISGVNYNGLMILDLHAQ
ncbi:hypothetical protein ANCCEY_15262, partial [Ancylostoma ceylanicum]